MVKSQLSTQIGRPKMLAVVLRVDEQIRREQGEVSNSDEDGEAGRSKVVVKVETQSSGDSAPRVETQGLSGEAKTKMSPLLGAAQAVVARNSPGWDASVLEGSLKTHQVAPGEGEPVHPNVKVSTPSQKSVDLQTVDGLHLCEDVACGGDALNAQPK